MDKPVLDSILDRVKSAVSEVGNYVSSRSDNFGTVKLKGVKNPQTEIDVEAEKRLIELLHEILPEAGFILEEHSSRRQTKFNWVIDPIDGTKFFSTHFPIYFTQVALICDDDCILSVVYNPKPNQMFWATKGGGAFLNGVQIRLSYDGTLADSIVNIEAGKLGTSEEKWRIVRSLGETITRLYLISTLFSCYILTNTVQAYVRICENPKLYDLVPRELLICEAGGVYHKLTVHDLPVYIAGHPKTVKEIENLLGLSSN